MKKGTILDFDHIRMVDFSEPFQRFDRWKKRAERTEKKDPEAMTLSTLGRDGYPDSRMVLLKRGFSEPDSFFYSFIFYTNMDSQKGMQLRHYPKAALCFHWKSLARQIRIRGDVHMLAENISDAYFASRTRGSQIGAWASQQSRPLKDRFALGKAVARETARFGTGRIKRPPYWHGYYLIPISFEFWRAKPFRLHERIVYQLAALKESRNKAFNPMDSMDMDALNTDSMGWQTFRLYP